MRSLTVYILNVRQQWWYSESRRSVVLEHVGPLRLKNNVYYRPHSVIYCFHKNSLAEAIEDKEIGVIVGRKKVKNYYIRRWYLTHYTGRRGGKIKRILQRLSWLSVEQRSIITVCILVIVLAYILNVYVVKKSCLFGSLDPNLSDRMCYTFKYPSLNSFSENN